MHRPSGLDHPRVLETRILTIRGRHVLLDSDLAGAYGVSTKALNQAVRRNAQRFPPDFCFQLTKAERQEVVTNCDHLGHLKFSPTLPRAFTEHGAIMAASVLRNRRAVQLSIYVVRAFVHLRDTVRAHTVLERELQRLERRVTAHDHDLRGILGALRQLLQRPAKPPRRIGFGD